MFEGDVVQLGSDLVRDFEPFAFGRSFVATASIDPAISIYPAIEWEIIVSEIDRLANTQSQVRRLQRILYGNAVNLTLSATNSLELPRSLKKYAGIRKRADALVFANKLEIWNPDTLQWFMRGFDGRSRKEIIRILRESSDSTGPSLLDSIHPLLGLQSKPKVGGSH
jgi:division/cell wall cluster transcriptional repressor MraZ